MKRKTPSPFPFQAGRWATARWTLAGVLGLVLSMSAQESDPDESPVIEITNESGPVVDDRADVTVTVTGEGAIVVTDEPAILGQGENWTVDNSGLLQQTGDARATIHLLEGTFLNQPAEDPADEEAAPGTILWQSGETLSLDGDSEERRFSSVFLESWTRNATNSGDLRLLGTDALLLNGTGSAFDFTAIHLGRRTEQPAEGAEAPDKGALITLTNRGEVSATWSGAIDGSGSDNSVRITAVHLEEKELLDNHGRIEAVYDGELVAAAGNRVEVAGIRSDEDADVLNVASGVVSAKIDATGTADGAGLTTVAIQSEGPLVVENHGTIEAIITDGADGTPAAAEAVAISSETGGVVRNAGTISAQNDGAGSAMGISIRRDVALGEDEPAGNATVENKGTIRVNPGNLAVNLENGGLLRNTGIIEGNVFLGDGDATLIITPDQEIDGTVDSGGGHNLLELGSAQTPFGPLGFGEYAGEFEGFDELRVDAQRAIWQLTGEQQYAAGTEVVAGVLNVKAALTSDVLVQEDGVFLGIGGSAADPLITGNIDVSGLLAASEIDENGSLALPEQSGPLTVQGDVTFREGSEFDLIGGHTWLESTGAVTIEEGEENGATLLINDSEIEWDDQFLVLDAGAGIAGKFAEERTVGFRPFLSPILQYGDNTITAHVTIDAERLQAAALTANQREIARVLANLDPLPGEMREDLQLFFREANFFNYGDFADSMSGEIIASGAVASASINQGFRQTIFNTIQHRPEPAAGYFSLPPGAEPAPETTEKNRGFWTRAVAIRGELERPKEGGDVDYKTAGLMFGLDFVTGADRRVGAAFGYSDSSVSRGGDSVDGDILQAAVYGTHEGELLVYDAILGYAFHDLESRRLVMPAGERPEASYNAHDFFASIQATMPLNLEGILVLPLAGLDFSHLRQGAFKEDGDWGLDGSSVDMNTLRASFGMRMMMEHITARNGLVAPEFRFSYSRALFDQDASFSATLPGDAAGNRFTTKSASINSGEFSLGTGVMVQPGRWKDVSIFADYDFHVQRHHLISLGFRKEF